MSRFSVPHTLSAQLNYSTERRSQAHTFLNHGLLDFEASFSSTLGQGPGRSCLPRGGSLVVDVVTDCDGRGAPILPAIVFYPHDFQSFFIPNNDDDDGHVNQLFDTT